MAARFCWVLVGLIVAVSMVTAIAGEWNSLGAPACCGPSFGVTALQPGCCEFPPSCCRGVWEGYCENKRAGGWCARCPGGPVVIGRRACVRSSQAVCAECETSLVPAQDPLISPLPAKTNDISFATPVIRVKPIKEASAESEARSLSPVIPLPPVVPDATE